MARAVLLEDDLCLGPVRLFLLLSGIRYLLSIMLSRLRWPGGEGDVHFALALLAGFGKTRLTNGFPKMGSFTVVAGLSAITFVQKRGSFGLKTPRKGILLLAV